MSAPVGPIRSVIYVKVLDDDTHAFGVQNCTDYDLTCDATFAIKLTQQRNWSYGQHVGNWCFFFPDREHDITRDIVAFRNAVLSQGPTRPILVLCNQDAGFGDRLVGSRSARQVHSDILVNRHGRRLRNFFRIETAEHIIVPTTPYLNDIKFGAFILGGPRADCPMDDEFIDLHLLPVVYRTAFVATIIAKVYAVLYGGIEGAAHGLTEYLVGKTFTKVVRRSGDNNNVANISVAATQSGKSKEILASAVYNIFLGRDTLVFVRNIGGNETIDASSLNLRDLSALVRDYVENVLDIDMRDCEGFIEDIPVYDGKTMKRKITTDGSVPRGFIYIERTNVSKLELPFKTIYDQHVGRDMYSLIIDEEDEQRQSNDATAGKTENVLYNKCDFLGDISIFNAAHLTIAYTATFLPLVASKPTSVEDNYRFNVFRTTPSANYKGHDYDSLPEERRIVLVKAERQRKLTKRQKADKTTQQIVLESNPGIRKMLDDMVMMYNDPNDNHHYLSALIACSAIASNGDKDDLAASLNLPGVPVVAFAQTMKDHYRFYCDTTTYFTDVTKEKLETALREAYNGTNARYKHKRIDFKPVSKEDDSIVVKEDGSFVVTFNKKSDKTIQIAYDIARMLYEITEQDLKPFIVCVSFLMANRGCTYKTSDHDLPLTHMYTSLKSKAHQYAVDVKQVAGRICGIDRYDFKRYLYAPPDFLDLLYTSIRVDDELIDVFSQGQHTVAEIHDYALRTFDQALDDVYVDSEVGKVAHHTKLNLIKNHKRANDELLQQARDKVARYDTLEEYTEFDRQVFDQGVVHQVFAPIQQQQPRFHRNPNRITQYDVIYNTLMDNIDQGGMTATEIAQYLVDNQLVQTYPQNTAMPEPLTDRHFVTQQHDSLMQVLTQRIASRLSTDNRFRQVINGRVSGAAQYTV